MNDNQLRGKAKGATIGEPEGGFDRQPAYLDRKGEKEGGLTYCCGGSWRKGGRQWP